MYRDRLKNTVVKTDAAKRLQSALLNYHDFQKAAQNPPTHDLVGRKLSEWQTSRLIETHQELYSSEKYRSGLEFLFTDLYAPKDFSARDSDLERIFPKLTKLMPDKILDTVARLVELNLLTQTLDNQVVSHLAPILNIGDINNENYSEAYRAASAKNTREQQLELVLEVGELLNRYARSTTILFSLKVTKGPAEMAGLSALHDFILRGFKAFHQMEDIPSLMQLVVEKERALLDHVYSGGTY